MAGFGRKISSMCRNIWFCVVMVSLTKRPCATFPLGPLFVCTIGCPVVTRSGLDLVNNEITPDIVDKR